ncbi:hypothetical protein [Massilia sp. LC238]|uniref:hypothetical protein n=1 Tax=Massilia sp. LC238 TaxID=1502852 RepID=UPI0004E445B3|nr:hypothetical protein [Massilia sp. LC238]KFC68170.1 hypothetical protein FG94_02881 [Massilia sp. LC238]
MQVRCPVPADQRAGLAATINARPLDCLAYLFYVNRIIELDYCDLHCIPVPKELISAACQFICSLAAGCHQFVKEG